jgi:hypothetical protein
MVCAGGKIRDGRAEGDDIMPVSLEGAYDGRVLGYDNAHGEHHRHFKGQTEPFEYVDYIAVFDRFVEEVRQLRKERR